jgi:hypothetical protein
MPITNLSDIYLRDFKLNLINVDKLQKSDKFVNNDYLKKYLHNMLQQERRLRE